MIPMNLMLPPTADPWGFSVDLEQTNPDRRLSILVVDDDPVFCRTIAGLARAKGVEVVTCNNLSAVADIPVSHEFDAVVMDYFLEGTTGLDCAYYLGERVPMLLVSAQDVPFDPSRRWPINIKTFFPKQSGPNAILSQAIALAKANEPIVDGASNAFVLPLKPRKLMVALVVFTFLSMSLVSFIAEHGEDAPDYEWIERWDQTPFVGKSLETS